MKPEINIHHIKSDEWIPCGMFHDLMDVTNTDVSENNWDAIGGYTIAEMFNAFDNSRPAHIAYLTYIAPIHGYSYSPIITNPMHKIFINNLGQ